MARRIFIALMILLSTPCGWAAEPPRVIVSIAPLHSLVAGVMRGVALPELLIPGSRSPHDFSLKPSQMRAITQAQVIFRLGKTEEAFLNKPLANLGPKVRVVEVMTLPEITLLPSRAGGVWVSHLHPGQTATTNPDNGGHDTSMQEAHEEGTHKHPTHTVDPHIWLNPLHAQAIVRAAVKALSEVDPERAAIYQANGEQLLFRLENLDDELRGTLASAGAAPFIVFHDAYQYFEQHYRLNAVGAITVRAEQRPGARRLREIRAVIGSSGAQCIFSEPQFPATQLQAITEGLNVRAGTLDPLGYDIDPGTELYFSLMRRLTSSLVSCLCQIQPLPAPDAATP